jgi:hypothetical protein
VVAVVLASAGLRSLLCRITSDRARVALVAALGVAATLDLSMVPFGEGAKVPEMPRLYSKIRRDAPDATMLEIPQTGSGGGVLNSITGYWQSIHGGKTSSGYSGHANREFDRLVVDPSPFHAFRLSEENYLSDPSSVKIDLQTGVSFLDYAWLYLRALGYDVVVLHDEAGTMLEVPVHLSALKRLLAPAAIYSDGSRIVYHARKLAEPSRPTLVCTRGWGALRGIFGRMTRDARREATMAVYQPDSRPLLRFTLEAMAPREPRTVRLLANDRELARWQVQPGPDALAVYRTSPFDLPPGVNTLRLVSDREIRPHHTRNGREPHDTSPLSLRVASVRLEEAMGR